MQVHVGIEWHAANLADVLVCKRFFSAAESVVRRSRFGCERVRYAAAARTAEYIRYIMQYNKGTLTPLPHPAL